MKTQPRCASKVGIVDKSLANLYHVHTDVIKSNLTLKDRAAFNMSNWFGQKDLFGADRRCRK